MVDILAREPWIQVVGEADTGHTGLRLLRTDLPDIAVVAMRLPDLDGIELCATATVEELPTSIVVHSASTSSGLRERARRAGAAALIDTGRSPDELIEVLRAIAAQPLFGQQRNRSALTTPRSASSTGFAKVDGSMRSPSATWPSK